MWVTCCLNMVFTYKSSRQDIDCLRNVKPQSKAAPEEAFCLDFYWRQCHYILRGMTSQRANNEMASMDVYNAVKATFSWFPRLLWRNFSWNHIKCKNNDQTCLFQYINICRVPRKKFEHLDLRPGGLLFKQLPQDPQMLMHEKTCMIPIIWQVQEICWWIINLPFDNYLSFHKSIALSNDKFGLFLSPKHEQIKVYAIFSTYEYFRSHAESC